MGLKHDGEAIKKFIRENPDVTASEFVKKPKWNKVPNSVFRYYRDQVRGEKGAQPRSYRRSPQRIYTTLWSKSLTELGGDGKRAVKELVKNLNQDKVINWEIVEIADPAVLEIREIAK